MSICNLLFYCDLSFTNYYWSICGRYVKVRDFHHHFELLPRRQRISGLIRNFSFHIFTDHTCSTDRFILKILKAFVTSLKNSHMFEYSKLQVLTYKLEFQVQFDLI